MSNINNTKKVYIDGRIGIDVRLIKTNPFIKIVDTPQKSDIIISRNTVHNIELLYKTIYIASEVPRTSHRRWCYERFDEFKLVVCYNPEFGKNNQIPFTPDDKPQCYPMGRATFKQDEREDTTIKSRGVFFAGNRRDNDITPDVFGGYNIMPLRIILGEHFLKKFPKSKIIGIGWFGQKTKVAAWGKNKGEEINNSDCDFVLSLENTYYPNCISEKLFDGFMSDRVTLYLGDINIDKHVPLNCFIDLRPYFNIETKEFNLVDLDKRIKEMTQEEYDSILKNARQFQKEIYGKHAYYHQLLTNKIINFIIKEC